MKGFVFSLLGIALVLTMTFFISCSSNQFKSRKEKIEMEGNPTTGYTWLYTIEDESIVRLEQKTKYLGSRNMSGAPSLFTYTVISLKPGRTKITFEYKRPWEDKPAEDTTIYTVTVDERGRIELGM
ncbi:MAG: protease inhibitor I42 family protein [Treponema sp.]|nr:protease inhibitor I42 family protein [Treponema sp.]